MSVPWLSALRDPGSKHNLIAVSTPSLCLNLRFFLSFLFFFFLKDFIYFQREGKRRREGEKEQYVVASHTAPTGDLACNPGMWFAGPHSVH